MQSVGRDRPHHSRVGQRPGRVTGRDRVHHWSQGEPKRPRFAAPVRRRQRWRSAATLPLIAAALGAVVFCFSALSFDDDRATVSIWRGFDQIASDVGLAVQQIELSGHVQTDPEAIFTALDASGRQSLPGMDLKAARDRILDLPWVRDARVQRVWPMTLRIHIVERTPVAVWTGPEGTFVVDRDGRRLQRANAGADIGLVAIDGAGADRTVGVIEQYWQRHPLLEQHVERFDWVKGRRWRLHLRSKSIVDLPEMGATIAIESLLSRAEWMAVRDGRIRRVDLRTPGRIIIRDRGASTAGLADAGGREPSKISPKI